MAEWLPGIMVIFFAGERGSSVVWYVYDDKMFPISVIYFYM